MSAKPRLCGVGNGLADTLIQSTSLQSHYLFGFKLVHNRVCWKETITRISCKVKESSSIGSFAGYRDM